MNDKSGMRIFSGTASRYLSEKIAVSLGQDLGKVTIHRFSDGEFTTSFDETVRGSFVFLVQSTFQPSDNLMELLFMIDAAKRASAYKIIAVIPYYGYARQDRKDRPRVAIGARLIADLLTAAGVSRVVTMELHADQIQGFFDIPVDHLSSTSIFIPYIKSLNLENLVVASPDTGGTKRAHQYSKFLNTDLVIGHKTRVKANQVEGITIIGDVQDKNVILVDDIIDTAGSITKAAERIMEQGARSVRAVITHPVLSGPAYERIEKSVLAELVVSDSLPLKYNSPKIKVISIADLFADVIHKVYGYQSISHNFII